MRIVAPAVSGACSRDLHKLVHLVDLIRVIIDLVQIILVLYHTAGGSHMMLVFDIRLGRITSMRLHSNRENEIFFRRGA